MSEEKIVSENENTTVSKDTTSNEASTNNEGVRLTVKKKRFKKSDILVFAICLVASILIWLYASNVDKTPVENGQSNNTPTQTEQPQET